MKILRTDFLFTFCIFCFLLFLFSGCVVNQHTLNLSNLPRPIYLGDKMSPSTTIDSSRVQIVRSVFCHSAHKIEDETRSEGEHVTFSSGDYDLIEENISIKVDSALQNHPNRFIGNVHVVAEVDRGLSLGAIFSAILGSQLTGEDSEIGVYSDQSFYVTGKIYELREKKLQEEE